MRTEHNKCLVLNFDYSPLCVISWKRALVWSIKEDHSLFCGVEIIDFYKNDFIVGTNGKKFPVPAVAKTLKYRKQKNTVVNFSRKNLFLRDNNTCQYCGKNLDNKYLTYDHVIPKSQWNYDQNGSPTNWTNIVTACLNCNSKKGNKTPKQANMPLINLPYKPLKSTKYLPLKTYLTKIKNEIPSEWLIYLPGSYTA